MHIYKDSHNAHICLVKWPESNPLALLKGTHSTYGVLSQHHTDGSTVMAAQ